MTTKSTFYEIPIEIRALKTASVYIAETDRNRFLIDTGMRPTTDEVLRKKGINTDRIDGIIITHLHIDHIGGAMAFRKNYGTKVIMGKKDAELCYRIGEDHRAYLGFLEDYYRSNGMNGTTLETLIREHPMHWEFMNYSEFEVDQFVEDGAMPMGDPEMRVLATPGHSPGSISPYFPGEEIFVGDHVLRNITPNISFYDRTSDMLSTYIRSLDRLKSMGFTKANPGHGKPFNELNSRIDEIKDHHRLRLEEVASIVSGDWTTAFETTRKMRWSKGRDFESMNQFEKNFAFGEAISHLRKLEHDGVVESAERDGINYFRKN